MKNIEMLIKKEEGNRVFSITRILNQNGHSCFQFRINNVVRWYFMAYNYNSDGISSYEIEAPFGLSKGEYESALLNLMSLFKVA